MDYLNTPTEGVGTSPAQRFLGRRCKTLLPTAGTLLQPQYSTERDTRALMEQKAKQEFYYNRNTKPLPKINFGETVRMKLPGQQNWTPGVCTEKVGPRSYEVKVGSAAYRRNRRHLLLTDEPTPDEEMDLPSEPLDNPKVEEAAIPLIPRRSTRDKKPTDFYVPT